jgi:hypothetical protein
VNNLLDLKENDEHALDLALHLSRHFSVSVSWTFLIWLTLSSPNTCVITARASVALFPYICTKFDAVPLSDPSRNLMHIFQIHNLKKKDVNISTSIQLHEILYTDSQNMYVLSSTVPSRYYNCCTVTSTSLRNHAYPLVNGRPIQLA